MARLYIIAIVFILGSMLFGEQPDSLAVQDSLSVCELRGHVVEYYKITREDSSIWVEDYPDSSVVFFYEEGKISGVITRCIRCGRWLGLPQMEDPDHRVIWKRKETIMLNNGLGGQK